MLSRLLILLLAVQGALLALALLGRAAPPPAAEPTPPAPPWQVALGAWRAEPPAVPSSAPAPAPEGLAGPGAGPDPKPAAAASPAAGPRPPAAAPASGSPAAASSPAALAASAAAPAPPAGRACLEAGPFAEAERARLEPRLREALPEAERTALRWEPRARAWWVALGPYADLAERDRQREAARALGLAAVPVPSAPGRGDWLVLSRSLDPAFAQQALEAHQARGLAGLRRVDITVPVPWAWRLPEASPAAQAALQALDLKGDPGRRFRPCVAFEPRPAAASAPR